MSFLTRRKSAVEDAASEPAPVFQEDRQEPRFESRRDSVHGTTRDSIGPLLRQTRESFGYDLQRISQALRIRYLYLDAIEKGSFERLPGPAYAVGFIRSYADFLGLDSDKILEFYKRDVQAPVSDSPYHFPEPVSETKVPGVAIIALCVLLAVVAYGSWYYASRSEGEIADIIPEVPERLKVLLEPEDQEVEQVIADATAEGRADSPVTLSSPQTENAADVAPAPAPEAPNSGETTGGETTAGATTADETTVGESQESETQAADGETAETQTAETQMAETQAPETQVPETQAPETAPSESVAALEEDEISALIDQMVGHEEGAATEASANDAAMAASVTAAPAVDETAAAEADDAVAAAPPEGTQMAEIPAVPTAGTSDAADLAPDPQTYGETSDDVRVVLRALEDCWVQVRDASGNLLLTRVMRPGDIYRVPDKQDLTLLAGNAGGLEVSVDGRPLPPLGPDGAVRRDISLNVDALLGGTANLQ